MRFHTQLPRTSKLLLVLLIILSACSSVQAPIPVDPTVQSTASITQDVVSITTSTAPIASPGQPISTATKQAGLKKTAATTSPDAEVVTSQSSPTVTTSPTPIDDWTLLPVIPPVTQRGREIYRDGLERGRNPHAFSKIGDCQSITTYFLSYFDLPGFYDLGSFTELQETIDWFKGSFSRESLAVKGGFNAAAVLSPLRADQSICNPDENPIACEYRVNNPSIALISLEEWWAGNPENYEKYMRQIIEYSISQGVLPIVATKADNLEGNHLINQTIARLAAEYDIPLWNFWLAVQPLENHGLILKDASGAPDMFHLTHGRRYYFYNITRRKQSGWAVRNLTALQVIDSVHRGLLDIP